MPTQTVRVDGYRSNVGQPQSWWVDTGITVNPGDEVMLDATNPGNAIKPWDPHPGFGPNGDEGNESTKMWDEALAYRSGGTRCWFGSLIGKIGAGGIAFYIGTSATVIAGASGTLFLAFNDGVNFEDNSGYWDVVVTGTPATGLAALIKSGPFPYSQCFLMRDFQAHQADPLAGLAGVDFVNEADVEDWNSGLYNDPLTRTPGTWIQHPSRQVVSMTDGLIVNVVRESNITDQALNPLPGENYGITVEVLTWYPHNTPAGETPDEFYILQYTHIYPTFGENFGGLYYPTSEALHDNGTIVYPTRDHDGVYVQIPFTRSNNVDYGPRILAGGELGVYAMIGLASVGPHLHISVFDGGPPVTLYTDGSGVLRPSSVPSDFMNWLGSSDRGGVKDPALYNVTCPSP